MITQEEHVKNLDSRERLEVAAYYLASACRPLEYADAFELLHLIHYVTSQGNTPLIGYKAKEGK